MQRTATPIPITQGRDVPGRRLGNGPREHQVSLECTWAVECISRKLWKPPPRQNGIGDWRPAPIAWWRLADQRSLSDSEAERQRQ